MTEYLAHMLDDAACTASPLDVPSELVAARTAHDAMGACVRTALRQARASHVYARRAEALLDASVHTFADAAPRLRALDVTDSDGDKSTLDSDAEYAALRAAAEKTIATLRAARAAGERALVDAVRALVRVRERHDVLAHAAHRRAVEPVLRANGARLDAATAARALAAVDARCAVCLAALGDVRATIRRACTLACADGDACECTAPSLCGACAPDYLYEATEARTRASARCPTCRAHFCVRDLCIVDASAAAPQPSTPTKRMRV